MTTIIDMNRPITGVDDRGAANAPGRDIHHPVAAMPGVFKTIERTYRTRDAETGETISEGETRLDTLTASLDAIDATDAAAPLMHGPALERVTVYRHEPLADYIERHADTEPVVDLEALGVTVTAIEGRQYVRQAAFTYTNEDGQGWRCYPFCEQRSVALGATDYTAETLTDAAEAHCIDVVERVNQAVIALLQVPGSLAA